MTNQTLKEFKIFFTYKKAYDTDTHHFTFFVKAASAEDAQKMINEVVDSKKSGALGHLRQQAIHYSREVCEENTQRCSRSIYEMECFEAGVYFKPFNPEEWED